MVKLSMTNQTQIKEIESLQNSILTRMNYPHSNDDIATYLLKLAKSFLYLEMAKNYENFVVNNWGTINYCGLNDIEEEEL